jgi:hypothetical protein
MNRFATGRDAKEYLIHRILAQADQDGVSLSDIERKMLYFSETCWTLPDMMAVNQAFDEKYDQDEYENKIDQIVQRLREQPDYDRDGGWDEAVRRLRKEDHYLLVLIDGAASGSANLSRWDIIRFALAGVAAVAVFLPITFFIDSHVSNPTVSKLIGEVTLLALVILAVYLANRRRRKSV